MTRGAPRAPRLAAALALALALAPASAPAAPDDGAGKAAAADLGPVRELLRKGDRTRALEAARAAILAAPEDVEAHLLYQDAAKGQVPVNLLQDEYRTRWEKAKEPVNAYLYGRLLTPAEGEKILADAVRGAPKDYWGQVGHSDLLARLGKAAPAETAALAALDLRPDDPRAALRAGAQCAFARRYASAEACYRRAVAASPGDGTAALGLAWALLRQGKVEEAAGAAATLLSTGNADARVLLFQAALAAEGGDTPAAEKALVQATTLDPGDADASMQLALLRLRKAAGDARTKGAKAVDGKAVAAEVAVLQKAAATWPERAEFRYALGYAHEITGNADGALSDYREASRLDPLDGDVLTAIGAILVDRGQLEDAAREFQHALDRDDEDAGALFELGFVFAQQGKWKESISPLQKLVKLRPKDAKAWHALGSTYSMLGKPGDAKSAFSRAVDLEPGSATYLRDLGEACFEARAYKDAEAHLAKAAEMDPRDPTVWTGLARTRTQMHRFKDGAEAYEKAAELRPKDQDLQILLGAYYHEFLKDYDKAIKHYNAYIALGGDAGDVGDWIDEATAELEKKK